MSASANKKNFTDEYVQKKAKELNCDVMYGDPHTLLLDIDSDAAWEQFQRQLPIVCEFYNVVDNSYEVLPSKSGNRHVIVRLDATLPLTERLMLQATLGSDPRRELLSAAGFMSGQENPVVLFRPKTKALPNSNQYLLEERSAVGSPA